MMKTFVVSSLTRDLATEAGRLARSRNRSRLCNGPGSLQERGARHRHVVPFVDQNVTEDAPRQIKAEL